MILLVYLLTHCHGHRGLNIKLPPFFLSKHQVCGRMKYSAELLSKEEDDLHCLSSIAMETRELPLWWCHCKILLLPAQLEQVMTWSACFGLWSLKVPWTRPLGSSLFPWLIPNCPEQPVFSVCLPMFWNYLSHGYHGCFFPALRPNTCGLLYSNSTSKQALVSHWLRHTFVNHCSYIWWKLSCVNVGFFPL